RILRGWGGVPLRCACRERASLAIVAVAAYFALFFRSARTQTFDHGRRIPGVPQAPARYAGSQRLRGGGRTRLACGGREGGGPGGGGRERQLGGAAERRRRAPGHAGGSHRRDRVDGDPCGRGRLPLLRRDRRLGSAGAGGAAGAAADEGG